MKKNTKTRKIKKLNNLYEAKKITKTQFAEKMGMSVTTLNNKLRELGLMASVRHQAIKGRYCDEAMAYMKGLKGTKRNAGNLRCNNKCKQCICCIETDENGEKQHVSLNRKD